MSEANPADGTDAGVTNIDIKQLLIKAGAIPDDPNVKSDPMYVNVFPKQVGNNPTPGGSSIFIADRVSCSFLLFYIEVLSCAHLQLCTILLIIILY